MPRVARQHAPGVVTHVIARFVNGVRVMDDTPGARGEYLARLDATLAQSDWRLLWYCLMGTHIHLGMESGEQSVDSWARPLHAGFAAWVNRRGRAVGLRSRGPVLADRPYTVMLPDSRAAYLAAYIHNNPVRAGLVEHAAQSAWSSHVAYLHDAARPATLDIARGLELSGYDESPEGRTAFGAWGGVRRAVHQRLGRQLPDTNRRPAFPRRRQARRPALVTAGLGTPAIFRFFGPSRSLHDFAVIRQVPAV
jgi:hypothetical protein